MASGMDRQMAPAHDVLTVDEVAEHLRFHPDQRAERWCRTGELPAGKVGRAYRNRGSDLDHGWAHCRLRALTANEPVPNSVADER